MSGGEFVIDTRAGVVHRRSRLRPECGLDHVPAARLQERDDELEATLVMKTRHYFACPHCYHP